MYPVELLEKRVWASIVKGPDCWEWSGYKAHNGYGRVWQGRRREGTFRINAAHRVVWELTYGPISAGMFVLH